MICIRSRPCLRAGCLAFAWVLAMPIYADILEERLATGSNALVPTAFPLNPSGNITNSLLFGIQQTKRDDQFSFVISPANNPVKAEEKVSRKDLVLGGQYPLGGAAIGVQYSEHRRTVSAKNENISRPSTELFVNRDYRISFGVDFTSEVRGAFTFHSTSLESDLSGNFQIGANDRTRYNGRVSGYGLGLVYQRNNLGLGAFTHPPMRGKATVEGEQKIITEPGIYGIDLNFKASQRFNIAFNLLRWSYKHDERDDPATSPVDQRDILLRGLDLNQFLRKTAAYGLAGEFGLTETAFLKAQYLRQEAVFLFDPTRVPGDDKDLESRLRYSEYKAGIAIKNRDFMAELGLMQNSAQQKDIAPRSGFGTIGDYKWKATGVTLMVGAAL